MLAIERYESAVRERERWKTSSSWGGRGVPCAPLSPTFVDAAERVAEREDEAGLAVDVARRGVCPRRGRAATRLLTSPSRPRRRGAIQDRVGATRQRTIGDDDAEVLGSAVAESALRGRRSVCARDGGSVAAGAARRPGRRRAVCLIIVLRLGNGPASGRTLARPRSATACLYFVIEGFSGAAQAASNSGGLILRRHPPRAARRRRRRAVWPGVRRAAADPQFVRSPADRWRLAHRSTALLGPRRSATNGDAAGGKTRPSVVAGRPHCNIWSYTYCTFSCDRGPVGRRSGAICDLISLYCRDPGGARRRRAHRASPGRGGPACQSSSCS